MAKIARNLNFAEDAVLLNTAVGAIVAIDADRSRINNDHYFRPDGFLVHPSHHLHVFGGMASLLLGVGYTQLTHPFDCFTLSTQALTREDWTAACDTVFIAFFKILEQHYPSVADRFKNFRPDKGCSGGFFKFLRALIHVIS